MHEWKQIVLILIQVSLFLLTLNVMKTVDNATWLSQILSQIKTGKIGLKI